MLRKNKLDLLVGQALLTYFVNNRNIKIYEREKCHEEERMINEGKRKGILKLEYAKAMKTCFREITFRTRTFKINQKSNLWIL